MIKELCLVLLLDGSGSIPADVWARQVQAHVAGLTDERVQRHAAAHGVAVAAIAFGWTPEVIVPWQDSPAAAARVLATQAGHVDRGGTQTGDAILAALDLLRAGPDCERQVVDLATDGQSNGGTDVAEARDAAALAGVVINAVTVRTERGGEDPGAWAREHAVTPGGFVIEAASWSDWTRAIQRKLTMEVAQR